MAQKTSKNAVVGCYETKGDDFLHLIDSKGADIAGIDSTGTGYGALQGGLIPPSTKTIFVDGNRTDSYTADGSTLKPFKTIMAGVNQVAANGDNSTIPYVIFVAPAIYPETIDLSNAVLVTLTLVGYGATVGGTTFTGVLAQAVNNNNLINANFVGFDFLSGAPQAATVFNFSSTTNGTNFGSGEVLGGSPYANGWGIQFLDCFFGGTGPLLTFNINNCGQVTFDRCFVGLNVSVTNCIVCAIHGGPGLPQGSQINVFTVVGPSPNGFVATQVQLQAVASLAVITIDAGSSIVAYVSRLRGANTVNGILTNRGSSISGNTTVNNGGTYKEDTGGGHSGSLTLLGSGAYVQTGSYGIGNLFLNGAQISTGTGSPQSVVTGSPGDIYLNKSGGAGTTLWVKESGTGTNTGWVGK